jgi:glutamyl-tRNA synthetase
VIPRERLAREFSLDHVSKNPAIMDPKKLDFINGEYLHAMSDQQFADEVLIPELHAHDLEPVGECLHDAAWYDLLAAALKPRTTLSGDVVAQAAFLYADDDDLEYDEKAVAKWLGKAGAREALDAAGEALAALSEDDFTPEAIEAALDPLPERLGMGKGKVFQPIRVAVVGGAASPGIGETLALCGRDHVLARIEHAKEMAQ